MSRNRSPLRNKVEALAFLAVRAGLRCLSLPAAEELGRSLGRRYRRLDRERRELVERNLARAFPERSEPELEALAEAVFEHFGGLATELAWSLDEPAEALRSRVKVRNADLAREAVSSGRGVFFLTAHLGNWELGALVTAALGMPMTVVSRPLDNPYLESRLRVFRERTGNGVLYKADAAREILRKLRHGGTIGILADQHARTADALVVPFFGRPASTTSAVARLADRTRAFILPVAAVRIAPALYELTFDPPIDVDQLEAAERTPAALTARINEVLERMICRNPGQWLWLHNRWKLD